MRDRFTLAGTPIFKRLFRSAHITLVTVALVTTSPVWAQPAPTPEEVQQAQVRWNEGKAYFDAGNFEAARVAFKQAYTVFPHAAFLQNLGEAELRTGRHVEAARHFTAFLRASSSGSPGQRELAKKSLAKASERLGSIVVTTNVDDAEIRIDEEIVGRSPLGSLTWYVEPGRHLVTARKEGYLDGTERVDVAIGPPRSVFVRVQRVIGGTSEAPPEEPRPATPPPAPPSSAPRVVNEPASSSFNITADSRRSVAPARTIVLISGAALTVAGVAMGTVFALRAGDDATRIRNAQAQLPVRSAKYSDRAPGEVCGFPIDPSDSDFCQAFEEDFARQRTDRQVRNLAFIGAGVLGVATLATAFFWRPKSGTVSIAPVLSPTAPGFSVFGNF
jgi:hypothetical protein